MSHIIYYELYFLRSFVESNVECSHKVNETGNANEVKDAQNAQGIWENIIILLLWVGKEYIVYICLCVLIVVSSGVLRISRDRPPAAGSTGGELPVDEADGKHEFHLVVSSGLYLNPRSHATSLRVAAGLRYHVIIPRDHAMWSRHVIIIYQSDVTSHLLHLQWHKKG